MPNHMHLIIEQVEGNGGETPIASLMKYTAHQFENYLRKHSPEDLELFRVKWVGREYNFWKPKPDIFELNDEETFVQKLEYIHANPLEKHWCLAKDPVEYLYSSARFYETGEKNFPFLYHYKDWAPSAPKRV